MAAWIFRRKIDNVDEFWTGDMDCGQPVVSGNRCDAYHFNNYDSALTTSNTHAALRDSDSWKVVRR